MVEVQDAVREKGAEFVAGLLAQGVGYKEAVRLFRQLFLEAAMRRARNNKAEAARQIGMHVNSLKRVRVQKLVTVG